MRFENENLILFFAALSEPGNEVIRHVWDRFDRGIDSAYLERMAEMLGVSAGLLNLCSRAGIAPGLLSASVRRAAAREFTKTLSMESLFRDVSALFGRGGIPFIPLKGVDRRIANARSTANPMEDIDILVRNADLGAARDLLERNGFLFLGVFSGAHMNFATDEESPRFIEVHWDLVNRASPVQRRLFHPDREKIWRNAVPVCGGLHLSPEDLVCYTITHAVKEYFRKPKWAADTEYLFRTVLPGLDRGRMRAAVDEWGVGPAFGMLALALDRATGGTRRTEAEAFGAVRPGGAGRYVAARLFDYTGNRRRRPVICEACVRSFAESVSLAAAMGMHLVTRKRGNQT